MPNALRGYGAQPGSTPNRALRFARRGSLRSHIFQHDFRMARGHAQEDPRRAGGFAPALFPIVKRLDGNAQEGREFALRQSELHKLPC